MYIVCRLRFRGFLSGIERASPAASRCSVPSLAFVIFARSWRPSHEVCQAASLLGCLTERAHHDADVRGEPGEIYVGAAALPLCSGETQNFGSTSR